MKRSPGSPTTLLITTLWAMTVLLAIGSVVLIASTSASAQAVNNSTEAPNQTTPETLEQIDNSTYLVDKRYDADEGKAYITLRSDKLQEVTLTDSGAFVEGGTVATRSMTLKPGETTTVSIPVTETDRGFVGVGVNTPTTIYAVPIEQPTVLIGGPWDSSDVQIGALTGALTVALLSLVMAFRALRAKLDEPERVA